MAEPADRPTANQFKVCPKCKRRKKTQNFSRHVRTCKGERSATVLCTFCRKHFGKTNFKRHLEVCKYRACIMRQEEEQGDSGLERQRLLQSLADAEIEIKSLRQQLRKKENTNSVLISVKADLALRLCKETNDKFVYAKRLSQTKEQLCKTKVLLAKKELEFTRRLANHTKTSNIVHNHYHQYAMRMTPWCIDPSHSSYEEFLEHDVREMREAMSILQPRLSICDKEMDTMHRQNIFASIVKKRIDNDMPNYIVVDIARHKGMFVMPDRTVRMDPGLLMMIHHQFKISMRIANTACDWFFLTPSTMKGFRSMITCTGGNSAFRIKQLEN